MRRAYGAEVSRYREALSDDVIAIHDKQKDLSDEVWAELVGAVVSRVPPASRIVDAGVGSGVVAARLAEAGFRVIGFDFNESMLGALRRRTNRLLPVAIAEVTALPVGDFLSDAVMVTNVLHLVRDWRQAISEAARVLRPGGMLFVGLGNTSRSSVADEISGVFLSAVGGLNSGAGPDNTDEFEAALGANGLTYHGLVSVGEVVIRTVADAIERLQHNVFMWPPDVPQPTLDRAAATTMKWAIERFGSIEAEYEVEAELALHVARRGGSGSAPPVRSGA